MLSAVNKKTKSDSAVSIARCFDVRREPSSRAKNFKSVFEATPDNEERRLLLSENAFLLFHLVQELLAHADVVTQAQSRSNAELEFALWTLEQLLLYLPDLIQTGCQFQAIAAALKRCLLPQNVFALRKVGMRLFLIWYQIVGVADAAPVDELDAAFAALLPALGNGARGDEALEQFCRSLSVDELAVDDAAAHACPFPLRGQPLAPLADAAGLKSRAYSLQALLDRLLEYVARECLRVRWATDARRQHQRCLRFLVGRLKRFYVLPSFDDLSAVNVFEAGRLDLPSPASRPLLTPQEPLIYCRYWLVRWIALYAYSHRNLSDSLRDGDKSRLLTTPDAIAADSRLPAAYDLVRQVLFAGEADVNMVLTLLREGLLLPLHCANTISRVVKILREWLFLDEVPPFLPGSATPCDVTADSQNVFQTLLQVLVSFYFNPYLAEEKDRLKEALKISHSILTIVRDVANPQRFTSDVSAESWLLYLDCLLLVVDHVIPISPPSTDCFARAAASQLFQTIFISWVFVSGVRGVKVSYALWDRLCGTLSERIHWAEVMHEWARVVDSVTVPMALYLYGVDMSDLPLERSSERKMKAVARFDDAAAAGDHTVRTPITLTAATPERAYDFCQPVASVAVDPLAAAAGDAAAVLTRHSDSVASEPANAAAPTDSTCSPPQSAPPSFEGSGRFDMRKESDVASVDSTSLPAADANSAADTASVDSAALGVLSGDHDSVSGLDAAIGADRQSLTPSPSVEDMSDRFDMTEHMHDLDDADNAVGANWLLVWRRMICCLGDLTQTADTPLTADAAMRVMAATIESLLKIQANMVCQSEAVEGAPADPIHAPPLLWLTPWLFAALERPSGEFRSSQLTALAVLAKVFLSDCRDCRVEPHLTRFLSACQRLMQHEDDELRYGALDVVCPDMFYRLLPQSVALWPSALAVAQARVADRESTSLGGAVRFAARLAASTPRVSDALAELLPGALGLLLCVLVERKGDAATLCLCANSLSSYLLHALLYDTDTPLEPMRQTVAGALFEELRNGGETALVVCENFTPLVCAPFSNRSTACDYMSVACEVLREMSKQPFSSQWELLFVQLLFDMAEWCIQKDWASGGGPSLAHVLQTVAVCKASMSESVMAAARTVDALLVGLLHQCPYSQFSIAQLNSSPSDLCDLNNERILGCDRSIVLAVQTAERRAECSLFVRAATGSQCYGITRVHSDQVAQPSTLAQSLSSLITEGEPESPPPEQLEAAELQAGTALSRLLADLAASSPECVPFASFPDAASELDDATADHIFGVLQQDPGEASLQSTSEAVQGLGGRGQCETSSLGAWRDLAFDLCLSPWARFDKLSRLEKSGNQLGRELRHLDSLPCRETHKVAVIYVAHGQEDKRALVGNESASGAFEAFVGQLGWEVALDKHAGYSGGLSASGTAPYYASAGVEMLFHVSTRLPADSTQRLRHLGNDDVHIVWTEHWRDYRSLIATAFGNALIVVRPVARQLFCVRVRSTSALRFGPLVDGALVDAASLGPLVRATALNASRAERRASAGWRRWNEQRAAAIATAIRNLHQQSTASDIVTQLCSE